MRYLGEILAILEDERSANLYCSEQLPLARQKLTSSGFRFTRNSNQQLSVTPTEYLMVVQGTFVPSYAPLHPL